MVKRKQVVNAECGRGISRSAWESAIQEVTQIEYDLSENADALTVQELAAVLGLGRSQAYRRAKQLVAAGKATSVRKRIRTPSGTTYPVAAYRLA